MASTSPLQAAENAKVAGLSGTGDEAADDLSPAAAFRKERQVRSHGRRASKRGTRARERKQAMLESMETGIPSLESLRPVLLPLLVPAALVIGITITGGNWPKEILYSMAVLMGLYVGFSAFRGVELVLACTLFYLPFSTTYVIPLAPGVNGTNMLMLLGIFASIMRAADERQWLLAWPPGTSLVFAFAVLSTFSGFTVTLLPGGFSHLLFSEFHSYKGWIDQFLLYFIAVSCIRDSDTAKRMIIYMGIGAIVLVLYSVPEMLDKMGRSTIEKSRIEGPHRQSNNFGGFVAYTLLPLVAIFLAFIKDIRAWLLTPYFLIAAKVLISTFSRGAYVAMALGGFLAAYYKGRGFLIYWTTLLICIVLVFPSVVPESIVVRLESITEQQISSAAPEKLDKSSEHRLILWRAAGEMILEDPILGKGFKGFPYLKSNYTESAVHESDPHNMYLYIGSQMGLPALSLFLLILGYSFHLGRVLSRSKEDRFTRAVGIGGAASTACYAIICLFGSRAVNLEFTAYFWTYLVAMQVLRHQQVLSGQALKPKKTRTNAFQVQASEQQENDDPETTDQPVFLPRLNKPIGTGSKAAARALRRELKSRKSG